MRVRYLGMKEPARARRCNCGGHRGSSTRVSNIKKFYLPSGTQHTFRVGGAQTVSERDGRWLLREYPSSFEEV